MKIAILKGSGRIAPQILSSYEKALINCGCNVKVIPLEKDNTFGDKTYKNVLKFNPDYVMAYGGNGFVKHEDVYVLRYLKIPLISLYFDVPFVSLSDGILNEMKSYPDYYQTFVWDSYFLDLLRDKAIKNVHHIMLAADAELFRPLDVEIDKSVTFVGTIIEDHLSANTNSPEVNRFIDSVIKLKEENLDVPILDICNYLYGIDEYKNILKIYHNQNSLFWSIIYYVINQKGSSIIRKNILEQIDYSKIDFFGTYRFKKANIISYSSISYDNGLNNIFQSSAINLNISAMQLETSVNNRIFDVFASRSFLLTDYRKDMETIFPEAWKLVCYKNLEELREKIMYFTERKKEREEISNAFYEIINSNHTYMNRVQYILDCIKRTAN